MKLYAARIFVKDWDEACDFYENTLKLPVTFRSAEMGWAQFDVGGPSLAVERVAEGDSDGENLIGRFTGLSLHVDDIDATYKSLSAAGVTFTQPPEKQPWGGTLAHFKDPAGNILTLLG